MLWRNIRSSLNLATIFWFRFLECLIKKSEKRQTRKSKGMLFPSLFNDVNFVRENTYRKTLGSGNRYCTVGEMRFLHQEAENVNYNHISVLSKECRTKPQSKSSLQIILKCRKFNFFKGQKVIKINLMSQLRSCLFIENLTKIQIKVFYFSAS
jgi:hypothetical protein